MQALKRDAPRCFFPLGSLLREAVIENVCPAAVMVADECRWYVAETRPQSERLALANLARQEFRSFFPQMRRIRRTGGRKDVVEVPVFPGYLFVRFNRERDPWRSINGTYGVKRLVGPSSARPQPVPDNVIRALIARCEPDTLLLRQEHFEPGEAVRFLSGPFGDRIAQIESLEANGRVNLLLEILGGSRRIVADPGNLIPA